METTKNRAENFSADSAMLRLVAALIRDFQTTFNDPGYCCTLLAAVKAGDIPAIRELLPEPIDGMSIAEYKATYQIQSVLKRYRFLRDTYSDEELIEKSLQTFRETQSRIANIDLDALPISTQRVLDLAAIYIADTLGVYSDEEHRLLCRFGRKASVGVPARMACEAARWELPISGSREQISWFDSEMSQVACVQEYFRKQLDSDPNKGSIYKETDSLKLTLVPKTFKSFRSIMPNTTIGSYMSFGLGEMIRKRLRRKGYDIRRLQEEHRILARHASKHGKCATADLSSASDSISVALVERLFPQDWFEVLRQSRIGTVNLPDGTVVESETFCTMGIGYTFPLQTLVFLALLKAIEQVKYGRVNRMTISVYGDDMIYVTDMHEAVVTHFEAIGFVINLDKTYHTGNFRESCGGDYYHGVDVRPFQPRNGSATVSRKVYEAILYKHINGLLMRWSEYEIECTLQYLVAEVESLVCHCKVVPYDYPDDAGIKVSLPLTFDFLKVSQIAKPISIGHGVYRFSCLRLVPDKRKETRHEPYLWFVLRGTDPDLYNPDYGSILRGPAVSLHPLDIDVLLGVQQVVNPLITETVKPISTFRSKLSGRRLRRQATYVVANHAGAYRRQTGVSTFRTP